MPKIRSRTRSRFHPVAVTLAVTAALLWVGVARAQPGYTVGAGGRFVYKEKTYPSAAAACTALLADLDPPQSLKQADEPDVDGNVHCVGTNADGSTGFDMWANGVQFERSPVAADAKPTGPPRSQEELLAIAQKHAPEGCGLSRAQQRAIAAVLGKKFTDVPYLKRAWDAAVRPQDQQAVASLTPNPAKNKDYRKKYFGPTRDRFWQALKADPAARSAFQAAGISFPESGNAATIMIDGKVQTIDVDHIVGLAEDPSRMIDASNLQLSPQRENRYMLEKIANNDAFYDPQAWMAKQAKKSRKATKSKNANGATTCPSAGSKP